MLPRSLRYSFVMLVGFVFESELRVVCHWLARRRRLPAPEDWTQSVLSRARKYLSGTVGITGVADTLWSELFDLIKVRNCIAHVGGRVHASSEQVRLKDLAARDIGLRVDTSERPGLALLVVEPEYCERVVATVEAFFTAIIKAGEIGIPPLAASRKNASERFGTP